MNCVNYVLLVAVDPATRTAVGLIKKKGPAFLINKVTFPGGKLELGETPEDGASREMREETGIDIPVATWQRVHHHGDEGYSLQVLAVSTEQVRQARQLEAEPVMVLDVDQAAALAVAQPESYAPDFLQVLQESLLTLGLDQPAASKV
jgi:8-oxo-dGTP pyrophosphatase MutT (NUDIX family)